MQKQNIHRREKNSCLLNSNKFKMYNVLNNLNNRTVHWTCTAHTLPIVFWLFWIFTYRNRNVCYIGVWQRYLTSHQCSVFREWPTTGFLTYHSVMSWLRTYYGQRTGRENIWGQYMVGIHQCRIYGGDQEDQSPP